MEKKIKNIVDCIEPVVYEQIWDTIHWQIHDSSDVKNLEDKELAQFEIKIYNLLLKELNKKKLAR